MRPSLLFSVASSLGWLRGRSPVVAALGREGRVLDVGCGEGDLFGKLRGRVVGVDSNRGEVERLKAKGHDARLGDVTKLEFGDGEFPAVSCRNVIEHLPPEAAREMVAEIARVLAPGGVLVLVTPMPATIWNTFGHVKPYPPASIQKLLRPTSRESFDPVEGLRIERLMYLGRGGGRVLYALTTALATFLPFLRGSYLMVLRKNANG